MSFMTNPWPGLLCPLLVPPDLQRPPGGAKAAVAATAGSRGWCSQRSWSGFSQQGRGQALQSEAVLGMVDPALAGIQSRDREQGTC